MSTLTEIEEYDQALKDLRDFEENNPNVIEKYRQLIEEYNIKREAAEKAVRAEGISCGDFDRYQEVTKIDGEGLYNELGREEFLKVGTIKTKNEFKVDAKRAKMAVSRGIIDQDTLNAYMTKEGRYHVPKAVVLP